MNESEPDREGVAVLLRGKETETSLKLIDTSIDLAEEYVDFADTIPLHIILKGSMGACHIDMNGDIDAIADLIDKISSVDASEKQEIQWQDWSQCFSLSFSLLFDKFGPPVICRATINDTQMSRDTVLEAGSYTCSFLIDLSYLAQFKSDLEALVWRYKQYRKLRGN